MSAKATADKMHIRHCILYEFQQGKNAAKACKRICSVLGENTVSHKTCTTWFKRFKKEDFDLSDKARPGQPVKFSDEDLENLLEENSAQTQGQLADKLDVDRSTVTKRLKKMKRKRDETTLSADWNELLEMLTNEALGINPKHWESRVHWRN